MEDLEMMIEIWNRKMGQYWLGKTKLLKCFQEVSMEIFAFYYLT